MRPERLELEGFTAFREATVLDFSDVDLFALTGPTGAGKSSLIDAVIFALYGSVPRYANKNLVAPVIAQQASEARVHLTFGVAGARYVVARVVRATASGGATTKEARLERHGPGGEVEVLAGEADGVTAAVERLLGLSYEHFTTCVVLPQGQFARFLLAKPAERQELLVRLLGLGVYGRMARLAGERQAAARARREVLGAALADLADLDEGHRQAGAARLGELAALVEAIDARRPELDALSDTEAAASLRLGEAQAAAHALGRVARPAGVAGLAAALAAARAEVAATTAALADAEGAVAAAEDAAAGPSVAAIDADLERWAARDELARRLAAGSTLVAERAAESAAAAAALVVSEAAAAAAVAAFEAAQAHDRAATLVEGLGVGDACPVCGEELRSLPDHDTAALSSARRAAEAAATAHASARQQAEAARGEHARLDALLQERRAQLEAAEAVVAGRPPVGELQAARVAAERTAGELAEARAVRAAARTAAQAAQATLAAQESSEREAWAALDLARDQLGRHRPPPAGRLDLVADWEALETWAAAGATAAIADADAARAEVEAARRAVIELTGHFEGRAAELGVPAGAAAVRDRVVGAREAAAADLARLEAELARASRVRSEHEAAGEAEAVARELALHLRADRFQRWLLGEAFERLVAAATGILYDLSGGAYSLRLDDRRDFAVVDHGNADTVRGVRTLSGGETFLASLALALALADQVVDLAAGGSARLESLFLDEGFGTLDPDTLDVVAAAIEELGSRGRMVGVVSHVRDLAERLPVRFEVAKGPTTATVVRRVA